MEALARKHNLKNVLVRVLSFVVLIFAVHIAYLVTVKGGTCNSVNFCFNYVSSPSSAAVSASKSRELVDYFSSIFQDLIAEGYLSPNSKSLCVETRNGEDVLALREIGVSDAVEVSKKASPRLIFSGEAHSQPFDDNTFDFEFIGNGDLDESVGPVEFASEITRTLKPGGFLVLHTKAKDLYSLHSFLNLLNCCKLIKAREIDGPGASTIREIVMKKETDNLGHEQRNPRLFSGNSGIKCYVPGYKRDVIREAEPLIEQEPLQPWLTFKRNMKGMRYLTSMVDISFKRKYIYVDVGARSYASSIGSWFMKQYPKQNKTFEIYAIEANKTFHREYLRKKGVTLLPYAAWVRNETLFFKITREPRKKKMEESRGSRGMGRIENVQSSMRFLSDADKIDGFDFAGWLKSTATERDFVVVKMDVEGTEFHLIERMVDTGAICLVDEIFLECHYDEWQKSCPGQRSNKYHRTYAQCVQLFRSLRENGVLVHQWW